MHNIFLKRRLCAARWHLPFIIVLLGAPQYGNAGRFCSLHHAYPEVAHLDVVGGKLVATLGDYFGTESLPDSGPVQLVLGDNGEWTRANRPIPTDFVPPYLREQCMDAPLDVRWLENNYAEPSPANDFGQEINACTTHGNDFWGGISFYAGEGAWGVGGIVRKDLTTNEFEYHRPYGLRDHSVSEIQYYDEHLWFGTTFNGECEGPQYGFGLKRYDLTRGKERNIVRNVSDVCGFAVRRFAVFDQDLWVATDLGLARSSRSGNGTLTWQNYIPDLSDDRLMRPVECADLYEELLQSPRIATDTGFDMGYAFEDFWRQLSKLRPDFVSQYLRELHGHDPAGESRN